MIHKIDAGYVISSRGTWLPGCYESEQAARYAFKFSTATLQLLQNSVNPGGVITFAMLQSATHTGGQGAASEGEGR